MSAALYRLYNAIWYPALPFAMLAGGGDSHERLGRVRPGEIPAGDGPRIWFHASSVGEVEALSAIAQALIREVDGASAIVTTMTESGREAARRRIPDAAVHRLAPFDHPSRVRNFIAAMRPKLMVITETEIWPGYFIEARRAGARIAIVNGRVSERSFERYQWLRPLLAEALQLADLVLAQTADDARRYRDLGAPRRRVVVTGNTKFDLARLAPAPAIRPALQRYAAGAPLIVAGSTAPGEEPIVIEAWRAIAARWPRTRLAIAPRHLKRLAEIEALLRDGGLPFVKASTLPESEDHSARILLLDTMGELRALYAHAAIAFVGGSLVPGRGGQSLAEPAAAGVPVLFGPYHESQRQIAAALLDGDGGQVVKDADDLGKVCAALLAGDARRVRAGQAARRSLDLLGGAVGFSIPMLKALIAAG
ncbi:MAG: 3-deoxy-D-manno-octulosonic acid transferase [Candidatus Binataceae bacterium]|nr:3-deoxy-D-manno-octulosonic acid transferase [Candidatus Binataceae bacterium]